MEAATVTIAGNVAADPRITGSVVEPDRVNLRVIANQRRFDQPSRTWVDAGEYSVNIVCWRQLARGVAQSVRSGDPVVVIGRINERKYEVDGVRKYATEVTASFIGHDLSRGNARFQRFPRDAAPIRADLDGRVPEAGEPGPEPEPEQPGSDFADSAQTLASAG